MKNKRFVFWRSSRYDLDTHVSMTIPRWNASGQDGVQAIIGDCEAMFDLNDDLWIATDDDGYYVTFQRVSGQVAPSEEDKLQ